MVELLLQAGADPNSVRPSGETPLMTATRANNLGAVRALLDYGHSGRTLLARRVDVNAKESTHGQTALMWALSRDHLEVARTLIEQGADVIARSDSGFSPLMFAARQGNIEAARMLLANGADVNERASAGGDAASSLRPDDSRGSATAPPEIDPLLIATVRGQAEFARFLLEQGADPNVDAAGYTPLHWVAGTWESQTTHEYISAGVQPGDLKSEWDALVGLQGQEKLDLIRALLAHGADPNARTTRPPIRFGYTFHNGSPAGGSSLGATPFLLAAMVGDVDVMRLLVEGGADPLLAADDGTTPLMVAAGMTNIEEEHAIPEERHLDAVKLCLELGADINAANDRGNTALHATAFLGFPEVARYLVEQGAELNPKNENGETPMRVAEGTIVTVMVFIHEDVAEVLGELGGVSEGIHPSFLAAQEAAAQEAQPDR